jgi:mannan endo-1,4-beta-mannosidase
MDETARVRDLLERATVPEPPIGPMAQNARRAGVRLRRRRRAQGIAGFAAVVAAVAASAATFGGIRFAPAAHAPLPLAPYLGVFEAGSPPSDQPVEKFADATGVEPGLVEYNSPWAQPFAASYARTIGKHGAIVIVQMDLANASVAGIAAGRYDGYLSAYAEAVRAYRHPVIMSFGREMNGFWYSWGYRHTTPAVFVAAWRHIVTLFRALGARNVIWLWTVSKVDPSGGVPDPRPWWPGNHYVNWVGIDGYYYNSSLSFAPLFGPTIAAVRALTTDPILIAETGVLPAARQPAEIADLFAGIRQYGLLGFVYLDTNSPGGFAITNPAAVAAFRKGASMYHRPLS